MLIQDHTVSELYCIKCEKWKPYKTSVPGIRICGFWILMFDMRLPTWYFAELQFILFSVHWSYLLSAHVYGPNCSVIWWTITTESLPVNSTSNRAGSLEEKGSCPEMRFYFDSLRPISIFFLTACGRKQKSEDGVRLWGLDDASAAMCDSKSAKNKKW
jgi:hypothetical protein